MIVCAEAEDSSAAVAYLRKTPVVHATSRLALERGIPPVPTSSRTARQADGMVVGVMLAQDFPHGRLVTIEADRPEAVPVLLSSLDATPRCSFVTHADLWPPLRDCLADCTLLSEPVLLTIAREDVREHDCRGEVRQLYIQDLALAGRISAECGRHHRPLAEVLQWCEAAPDRHVAFGAVHGGEVVSFVDCCWDLDDIWGVGMMRTLVDERRKGYAKAVLSRASRYMLDQGVVLTLDATVDTAAYRTGLAVGYREVCRRVLCEGSIRDQP